MSYYYRYKNVIHLLYNTCCQKKYIEKLERPFYFRLNNNKHWIKSMDYDKLLSREKYSGPNSDDFKRGAKFIITEPPPQKKKNPKKPVSKNITMIERHND